ncbi:MAG: putative DNA binding domain-containing protein [Candidatus Kapabacteria bacterium]|nr:putative DNA binding domain-containing protein [Candidatus Kapabacteria bacterium]MBX7153451.1 putative DNA binding domain-containing protein [Bacteroidota bacterium]
MTDKNDLLNKTISRIETTLLTGQFQDNEDSIVELKDLSSGNEWTSLKETVCAYLNTNGGYVICGIRERNKKYNFTGFDRNNEGRLIELRSKFFRNDNDVLPDLSQNIDFDYRTVHGKTLAILTVHPLSEDLKYLKFDGVYYERVLTQDKVIPQSRLIQHREYKAELEYSKEISPVAKATIYDLDIDKINQFIVRINTTGKKETVKKDLQDAADFLARRYCINSEGAVTVLGLLLFGKEPFQYLEYRAEVDCYFETGNDIGRDKRISQNDVINLMDDAFSFVWGHIKVGRSYIGGGRSEPEFPEKLVREVVNNAFAHRDYIANKFITIKINPGESIEIKNPGSFKQKMLITDTSTKNEIRRIISGVPETKNPKLANVLKAFDKIESQGIGMATLVSVCLENQIDVPYYDLSVPDTISLVIPSGKLMDDETLRWMNSFNGYLHERLEGKITQEHKLVLAYLLKSERLNQKRRYTILLSPSNNHLDVLSDLKQSGLVLEHPSASSEQTPVYVLDKELTLVDFTKQIEEQTGKPLTGLDDAHKRVLNIVYRYNHYNNQSIKPNVITPELYSQLHGKEIEPTTYESLGRKVRKICGDLLKADILSKKDDKSYEIKKVVIEL